MSNYHQHIGPQMNQNVSVLLQPLVTHCQEQQIGEFSEFIYSTYELSNVHLIKLGAATTDASRQYFGKVGRIVSEEVVLQLV
jgi:hypothetical protein